MNRGWKGGINGFLRAYSLVWLWFGLLGVIGLAAYGASSSLDFLTSQKFAINGKASQFPIINYNGNIYVPLAFVGEEMYSEVHYDDNKELIIINQQNVKFDEQISAPVPYVAYERRYKDGTRWMQEIPLLLGGSCWKQCIEVSGSVQQRVQQTEYPPVSVTPGSSVVIKYPPGLEPSNLKVYTVHDTSQGGEQTIELELINDRLHLPEQPGVYNVLIISEWKEGYTGYTSYAFVVHITDR
ncbi:copper amine oxidase [Paenibacillus sp. N1-5-1-14]|uniref:copper amine oxidase n=1 Tax=Paenibacillus radicibacter TaxID=2972488 RepID=UPI002159A0E6|nr:copper amine oxidase [Paenibacillus radicibacter]MCR8645953.1 copper amine oxidase [Paenibacillus radicibacter]